MRQWKKIEKCREKYPALFSYIGKYTLLRKDLRGSKSIEQGQAGLRSVVYKERPDEWESIWNLPDR